MKTICENTFFFLKHHFRCTKLCLSAAILYHFFQQHSNIFSCLVESGNYAVWQYLSRRWLTGRSLICRACAMSTTEQMETFLDFLWQSTLPSGWHSCGLCLWWDCGEYEPVPVGLWLLTPCHSSGRCFMACNRKVPLAFTAASSPGAVKVHLQMTVRRYWRREHYHVVLRPFDFLKNSEIRFPVIQ